MAITATVDVWVDSPMAGGVVEVEGEFELTLVTGYPYFRYGEDPSGIKVLYHPYWGEDSRAIVRGPYEGEGSYEAFSDTQDGNNQLVFDSPEWGNGTVTISGYTPGKARYPTPADNADKVIIRGIDTLKYLQWEAPE